MEEIFSRSVDFLGSGRYASEQKRRLREICYCKVCIQDGYHSYFHEMPWLSMCPFHNVKLEKVFGEHKPSIAESRIAALELLLSESCMSWPHCQDHFPLVESDVAISIAAWVARARAAAASMSLGEVWCLGEDDSGGGVSLSQSLGQLRVLEVMPDLIEPLFIKQRGKWDLEVLEFPMYVKLELSRLKRLNIKFGDLYEFYKEVTSHAPKKPVFVERANHFVDVLRARHGSCTCRWALVPDPWEYKWAEVDPGSHFGWRSLCPFQIAIEELNVMRKMPEESTITRKKIENRILLSLVSRQMLDANLISYTKDAKVSAGGYLTIDESVARACIWRPQSPLTDLLNTAAEWEVDVTFDALKAWLDDIEHGAQPFNQDRPKYSLRLRETSSGMSLVKWTASPGDQQAS
ncbi:hypothetical protein [Paraburkholderia youngii]|uniref:hypothetical protein n=1 Tax=Paraburkholderia youngii TaxID=2782701 RepID=UPI003D22DCBE